jgi:hypothetical protein
MLFLLSLFIHERGRIGRLNGRCHTGDCITVAQRPIGILPMSKTLRERLFANGDLAKSERSNAKRRRESRRRRE